MLAQVPYALVIDRVYVHGDPVLGQKRGIALHSSDTASINSYVSDCKAVGQDSQAMSGFNGPGNYLIENNYLEGATENVLFGGADPMIPNLVTTTSPSAATTCASRWRGAIRSSRRRRPLPRRRCLAAVRSRPAPTSTRSRRARGGPDQQGLASASAEVSATIAPARPAA